MQPMADTYFCMQRRYIIIILTNAFSSWWQAELQRQAWAGSTSVTSLNPCHWPFFWPKLQNTNLKLCSKAQFVGRNTLTRIEGLSTDWDNTAVGSSASCGATAHQAAGGTSRCALNDTSSTKYCIKNFFEWFILAAGAGDWWGELLCTAQTTGNVGENSAILVLHLHTMTCSSKLWTWLTQFDSTVLSWNDSNEFDLWCWCFVEIILLLWNILLNYKLVVCKAYRVQVHSIFL